ncbi:MAG TPA: Mov34/MPN/PAD-1 family protein [Candidatus Nanoarchaeia archaeon]|nr:Mov34/MPN/PAD-1 family protein [Candidatus Nanoarchaeia archaeon]
MATIIREQLGGSHRKVFLSRQAFVDLLVSAIEVYKKEAFGLLIGRKENKRYFISDIVPYQSAKRSYDWVNMTSQRINRINFALKHLTNQQVIGDYHSHPQGPDKLSATDVGDLFKGKTSLTILLCVYKKKSCVRWTNGDDDYALYGSVGGNYFVRMLPYEIDRKTGIIRRIKIVCPYIRRVNKQRLYSAPMCK